MIRTLTGWEEELSTNSRINTANMITQDWRESNEKIIIDLQVLVNLPASSRDLSEMIESIIGKIQS